MKLSIDSNDLPAATRLATWRGMLCDTFMGMDCHFPSDAFRSVIDGYAVGDHTITRITSSRHAVERSRTLIKRDGAEVVFFGVLLAGRATIIQGGRETAFERGAVIVSDTTRPFRTQVDSSADIIWVSVPKKPIAERVRGIEDLVAFSLRPRRPIDEMVVGMMAGFDEASAHNLPAHEAERLATQVLDLLAMSITSGGLPSTRSWHVMPGSPIQ